MKKAIEAVVRDFLDHYDIEVEDYKLKELGDIRREYDKKRFEDKTEAENNLVERVKQLFRDKKIINFDKDAASRKMGEELEKMIRRQF